ncbi:multidrug effflux MFS transporter [Kibdelosporangium persicum]|uniref:Multidrug effflux MFS transporter n=1 Tax=Kibdelosporangium persicum TaxID=2698649 RepID=A0ABX2F3X0_9PSEU|nr:Multidrug effflux MFS transporter [Kibdelosporangium persicum]
MSVPGRLRFTLILGALSAFAPLSIDMYLPGFPAMTDQLHASASEIQLTLTAFVISLALGQAVAGPLSDAYGRRRPLVFGLVLYAIASVACAFAPSAYALVAFRFVQGLGAATGIVIARAAVRDLFSGVALARFFSTMMLVTGLAPILAPVIGGQLLQVTSWRGVFVVLAAFGVVLLLSTVFALPETLPSSRRRPARVGAVLRSYGGLLRDRVFLGYALTSALLFAAIFAYISGSPFVLQDVYGLSPQQYSWVFGVNSVGIVLAGQIGGWLVGRVPPRRLVVAGLGAGLAGGAGLIVAVAAGAGLFVVLAPMFLIVSSVGIVMPNASALALADQADNAGAASALIGISQFIIGGGLAPLAGHGALAMAVLMGSVAVGSALAYVTLTRHKPNREDSDHGAGDDGRDHAASLPGEHATDDAATTGEQELPTR